MHVAICDDNPAELKSLKLKTESYISKNHGIKCEVSSFNNEDDLLKAAEKKQFDLLELDIELSDHKNGIATAQKINRISPLTQIIFITAYQKYYLDVYDADHTFFIVKNKEDELLPKALQKVLDKMSNHMADDTVSVSCKGNQYLLKRADVLYVEKRLRIAEFCFADRDPIDIYLNAEKVLELLGRRDFIQVHRSFIINMRHIEKLNGTNVTMSDGKTIPIGSTFLREFQEKLIASHQESR